MDKPPAQGPAPTRPSLRRRLLPYAAYAALVAVYYLSARMVGLHPELGRGLSALIGLRSVPILVVAYLLGFFGWIALVEERTLRGTGRRIRAEARSREMAERLLGIPFFVMGTVYTFDIYAAFKQGIPVLATYGWDGRLAELDAVLHLWRDPWRWSHAVLGDAGTRILDRVYGWWYVVLIASVPLFATWAPKRVRARFFLTLTFVLMVGGSFLAVLFASGGPCYFGELAGDAARFGPLMARLEGTQALATQARLWEVFTTDAENLYGGISAMPSMHVAVVALLAVAGAGWNRWLGGVAGVYAVLIFLGSFHLGWHYAVDGYASALLVAGAWVLTRPVLPGGAAPRDPTREEATPPPEPPGSPGSPRGSPGTAR